MKNTTLSGAEQEAKASREFQTSVKTPLIAPVVLVSSDNGGWRWMVVTCPICGAKGRHFHGAGGPGADPRKSLGHRLAHCASPVPVEAVCCGYELMDILDMGEPEAGKDERHVPGQ